MAILSQPFELYLDRKELPVPALAFVVSLVHLASISSIKFKLM